MVDRTIRVGMWTGPRNISTTMMRAFENRPDTSVIDEPFYAYYLKESGSDHPMREQILTSLPQDWHGVVERLNGPTESGAEIFFHKHISYHLTVGGDVPLDWIDRHRTFLLIRDPRAMVASFAKKFSDVAPIKRSLDVQLHIYRYLTDKGLTCPIVDAADILKNPSSMLQRLCSALDISFTADMLSWPMGPRESDGVWASHWYDAVMRSNGFMPYTEKYVELTPQLNEIAESCFGPYELLLADRLTV